MVELEKGKLERYSMSIYKVIKFTWLIKYIRLVLCTILLVLSVTNSNAQGFCVKEGIPHLPVVDPMSIPSPTSGMMIYSTVDNCPMIFTGLRWGGLCDNKIDTETTEDYFVVKEGIPFVPIKNTISENAQSGAIYYSIDIKSMMIYTISGWVKITDLSKSNFVLKYNFETVSGNIKTWVLPVLDKDPTSSELSEGAFYLNSVSKSIRYLSAIEWKDISCIPEVKTLDVTNVTDVNTVSGENILSNSGSAITKRGICWDVNPNPTVSLNTKTESTSIDGFALGEYPEILTNLMSNTTYYVRAYAINSAGIAYGDEKMFKTIHGIPEIVTLPISEINSTTATGGGNIKSNGGAVIQGRGICWSNFGDPKDDPNAIITNDGSGVGVYPSDLVGLMGNEKYYVRAYAYNRYGMAYGNLVEFTSLPSVPPVLSTATLNITDITNTSAIGSVTIINNGGSIVTERGICWSTDKINYHKVPSSTINPSDIGVFISKMTGLTFGTLYYVKGYATNIVGTSYSSETSFITTSLPELTTLKPNGITGYEAISGGEITNNGDSNIISAGVCWSINSGPTISDIGKTIQYPEAPGTGVFTSDLKELQPDTKYYIRAYATNEYGTAYGNLDSLTTAALATITTDEIISITNISAECGGTVVFDGRQYVSSRGICWGLAHNPTISDNCIVNGSGIGSYIEKIKDLMGNTTYYVRAYAINGVGVVYGKSKSFKTAPPILPEITTSNAHDIGGITAWCGGIISKNGGAEILSRGICWSSNPDFDPEKVLKENISVDKNVGIGGFNCKMSGLTPNTKYYVRAFAENSVGIQYGDRIEFSTFTVPTVVTSSISDIKNTTATGGGDILSDGGAKVTSSGICWSKSELPTIYDGHTSSGIGIGSFIHELTNIMGNTTYYVRAYAINNAGIAYGNQVVFTTAPPVLASLLTKDAYSEPSGKSAICGGELINNGGDTIRIGGLCCSTISGFNPEIGSEFTTKENVSGSFTSTINGLTPGTKYYVRAYIENDVGRSYASNEVGFTTFDIPAVKTISPKISSITSTESICGGEIINNGGTEIIESGICWGKIKDPTIADSKKSTNVGSGSFEVKLTNLLGSTTYYVRAYAINSVGITYGNEISFVTSPPVLASLTTNIPECNSESTAISGGDISSNGGALVTTRGIYWSTKGGFVPDESSKEKTEQTGYYPNNFESLLKDLIPNTIYYVRAYVISKVGTAYGDEVSFRMPDLPKLTTKTVYDIKITSAYSGGDVIDDGGVDLIERGIIWSTDPTFVPSLDTENKVSIGGGIGTYSCKMPNLKGNTTYYVRAYARNIAGTTYGNLLSYKTYPCTIPTLTTRPISDVWGTSSISGGYISDDGGDSVTDFGVIWGTQKDFPQDINTTNKTTQSREGARSFTSTLSDLKQGTTYYVRAYAMNGEGVAFGNELSFTTLDKPKVETGKVTPTSTGRSANGGGVIIDNGGTHISNQGVCWGMDPNPTIGLYTKTTYDKLNGSNFSSFLKDLEPVTTYYVRAYAVNNQGVAYGENVSFTTLPALPTLSTNYVSILSTSSVVSGGDITDDGGAEVTERGVLWDNNSSFNPDTVIINKTADGIGIGNYRSEVSGLEMSVTYYIRAYAKNIAGIAYGNQVKVTIFPTAPRLHTKPVTDTTGYSGISGGIITSDGGEPVILKGLCWSKNPNPVIIDNNNKTENGLGTDSFTQKMTGLEPNTLYYVRAYAVNRIGTAYGEEMKILTHALPTITATDPVTNIIATTATSGGEITDNGRTPIISRGICWSRYSNPTINLDTKVIEGDNPGIGSFKFDMSGLKPETKYYVRAFATNSVGTNYGSQVYFTTKAVMLPQLITNEVTDIKSKEALSGGKITDDGGMPVTERGICWSTSQLPTIDLVSKTHSDSGGIGTYTNVLAGLMPHTKYYVRAYAINILGVAYGNEVSFTTECVEPELSLVTISDINMISAKGAASIVDNGGTEVTECGLYINTADTIAIPPSGFIVDVDNDNSINGLIEDLKPKTKYYAWAYAINRIGKAYSATPVEFTTPTLPTLTTNRPTEVTDTTAICGGTISDEGGVPVLKRGVCWGETKAPDINGDFIEHTDGGAGAFNIKVENLHPGVKYYVRAYATNSMGISYGNLDSIKTLNVPTLITAIHKDVTKESAISGGDIIDDGGQSVLARGVCWDTLKNPTVALKTKTIDGTGIGEFLSNLTNLKRVTKYYIRSYATNSVGTGYGKLDSIVTLPDLPIVSNVTMSNMVNGSSDGTAEVLDDGGAEVTERGLCLSTKGDPEVTDETIIVGGGLGSFTGVISGLIEGPTYYIRAYATNSAGSAYSEETLSFKICPSEFDVIHTAGLNGAPESKTVTYHSVSTNISGAPMCWLTQNLGADQEATAFDDATTESAGWYWQFNRKQGYKHDGTKRTPNFAYVTWITGIDENCPWYAHNDPCRLLLATGWRLPTYSEWVSADGVPQNWSTQDDTYNSVLKLHSAGYLYYSNGALTNRGKIGYYWSSNNYSYYNGFYYNSAGSDITYTNKAYALPVRCIRDTIELSLPTVSNVEIPASKMTPTTATCTAVITTNGGAEVTQRGFCWSIDESVPSLTDSVIYNGNGVGSFTSLLDKLEEGPTYYVRAFAINSKGTGYSPVVARFKICPTEFDVIHTAGLNGAPETKTITYHSVSSFITGEPRCWLTQNLGAEQQPLSKDDASEESAGWYWQFNRKQGYKYNGTVRIPNYAYVPWISAIDENIPWYANNDPCNLLLGAGWRIPTKAEWIAADAPPQNWGSKDDTYNSVLKLHSAGYLYYSNGALTNRGSTGYYWSSNNYSYYNGFYYNSAGSDVTYINKAYALPVRCLRDNIVVSLPSVSDISIPTSGMTKTSASGVATIATDGGADITERGICWNTNGKPTIDDNKIENGIGTGKYITLIEGLEEGPTYYVRAYATNKKGTAYSPNVTTFKICPTEFNIIHTAGLNGAPETRTIAYHSISSSITGEARCWLTQNLGAEVQPKSKNDNTEVSAGWYWQFNRKQGYKHDGTTRTPNLAYIPWISRIDENIVWKPDNDPCNLLLGGGWRLPTRTEWVAADAPPQNWVNLDDTYNSDLKLHTAGYLIYNTGALASRGVEGYYWSSTNNSYYEGYCYNSNGSPVVSKNKAFGFSVRCLRDNIVAALPTVSNVDLPTTGMSTTSATGTATIATDGGSEVTERGLCWNTTGTPSVLDNKIVNGGGIGKYSTLVAGLEEGPTYYVRAYAVNSVGIAYSPVVTTFKICPTAFDVIHTEGLNGAPVTKTVTYHSISSAITGEARCWLTQNLGASQEAISANDDSEESAGWYWQFNRKQGYKYDGTTRIPNLAYVPWITRIDENIVWKPENDPCNLLLGGGWRIPTKLEWIAADAPPQNWISLDNTYNSVLKLHTSGYLAYNTGILADRGKNGYYWSSTNNSYYEGYYYNSNGAPVASMNKAYGLSVRCLRDKIIVALPTVSNVDLPTKFMTTTSVTGTSTVATDGGAEVTERGLCWSIKGVPTISDNVVPNGKGTGIYTTLINGLEEGPTYYVRAYATNSKGTAYSKLTSTFKICPTEFDVIHTEGLNGAPETKTVTYHSISSAITGEARCWLTQNLGADIQPESAADAREESAGWYWQFNRKQGYKHDGTIRKPNLAYVPWITGIDENISWTAENDPCNLLLGKGWRLPTRAEWIAADAPPQNWGSADNTFKSVLKLHSAGYLVYNTGALADRGVNGFYWSSTTNSYYEGYYYNSSGSPVVSRNKAFGQTVRCIRNEVVLALPTVSNVVIPTTSMTTSSAEGTATVATDGGAEVTARGLCWNTTGKPTIDDSIAIEGNGTGEYTSLIDKLKEGPTYYVRAFATNKIGTSYSPVVTTFKICPTKFSVIHTEGLNGAPETKTVIYNSISSAITGEARCWLTQNLGADRQALSLDDKTDSSAGWYWQFNRKQGFRYDGTTRIPNLAYIPWISGIDENVSWAPNNDPCNLLLGTGWRLPTKLEWIAVDAPPQNWKTQSDTYNSVLKLHSAGYLVHNTGALADRGVSGFYWSSTTNSYYNGYYYNSNGADITDRSKAYGQTVRCIRDNIVVALPTVSNVEIPTKTMTKTSAVAISTVATNGGAEVTDKGICWNTTGKPTISDNKVSGGAKTGLYNITINGLTEGPTYYVRSYATNAAGTAYSFKTSTFKICPTEFSVIHTAGLNGAPETKTVTYHSISTDITGEARCWLTQNLGASVLATSSSDTNEASAGWYWQFNRKQGYKHDGTNRIPNLSYVKWISQIDENIGWYQHNDPCHLLLGSGWRIPTKAEWIAADAPPQNWGSKDDTFKSVLKLHSAGYLYYSNGTLTNRGSAGYYWSSNNYSYYDGFYYNSAGSDVTYIKKTYALPVRCLRDKKLVVAPSVSNVEIPTETMTSSSAKCTSTITPDGGANVTERGFCWNTTGTPTISDNILPNGTGVGIITGTIVGLVEGPTYYVRAYAKNSAGTTYSPVVSSFKICPTSFNVTHTSGINGAVDTKTITYHSISSNITGYAKCWLTQNLGADIQPSSATDGSEVASGWYWQFNRKQAFKHNGTTRTPSNGWITNIDENIGWYRQNDPCSLLLGEEWRIPTQAEWTAADAPPQYWTNTAETYSSVLKLHASGYLNTSGTLVERGVFGYFWSSNNYSYYNGFYYKNNGAKITYMNKKNGLAIRCIKD